MSRGNDPVDAAITYLGGWLIGLVIGLGAAIGLGWIRRKEQEERIFKLPGALRVDYGHPEYQRRQGLPWHIKNSGCLLALTGYLALGLLCGGISGLGSPNSGTAVLGILAGIASGYFFFQIRQARAEHNSQPEAALKLTPVKWETARIYTVHLSKSTPWRTADAGRFMQQMLQKLSQASFQIVAEQDGIHWRIIDFAGTTEPGVIRQAVAAFYPEAEVTVGKPAEVSFAEPFYRCTQPFQHNLDFIAPIQYVEALAKSDPLVQLTNEMSDLRAGERVAYTLVVTEPAQFVYDQAENVLTIKPPANPFSPADWGAKAYRSAAGIDDRIPAYEKHDFEVVQTKLRNLVYQALLFIQIEAPTRERVGELYYLTSHISQFSHPVYNTLIPCERQIPDGIQQVTTAEQARRTSIPGLLDAWLTNRSTEWREFRLLLDTQELAALWHLPHEGFHADSIVWTKGRQAALPKVMRGQEDGVLLGVNRYAGQTHRVYLPDEDRATHISIIGRTGVGKSTLLHHLIRSDIAQGRGVAVIDPKGHLVRDILRASIAEGREDDVVVLDIADFEHPPPFNLLASPGEIEHGSAVGLLLAVFEKVYPDFQGTRMADTFSMALQTLWAADTPTVMDVERLFEEADYRQPLVQQADGFVVRNFWRQFESRSQGQRDEFAYPVIHKMRRFYGNRYLCPIMCHPQPLNLHRLIAEGRIILVSLNVAEAKIPRSEQNLLGAVLITQIQMAAMDGAIANPPFTLYVDEAQHFVTTSLPQMLAGARGWGLSVVLANQFLKQLTGDVLDAVLGSVGAVIAFQCGEYDARTVARMRPGFTFEDLMHLDRYKAGVFTTYRGETQPAFSLETQSPPTGEDEDGGAARELYLRGRSATNYTPWTRAKIDAWLNERYDSGPPDAATDGDFYDPVN